MTHAVTGAPPLSGIQVIELAGIGPGPMCGRMLAELGAEVVRVARPDQPVDVAFPVSMRGRREVILDLKADDGWAALRMLIAEADVLIDPFRPGVCERLGFGPDDCLAVNPALIYGRITGWGQDGPLAHTAGHDINYIAITGALDAIGRSDGPPQPPLNLLGDFGGGTMYLLIGILAALYERTRSGRGQVVDAAIVDGVVSLTGYIHGMRAMGSWQDARGTNRLDTGAPYYDVYETADGKWLAVGAIEQKFYAELLRLSGVEDVADRHDRQQWPELRRRFAACFHSRDRDEWETVFAGSDACVTPVLTWSEAEAHPHLVARASLSRSGGAVQPMPAPRFGRSVTSLPAEAQPTGSETEAVLAEEATR
jgi:alpha-methylacyl-CoA racemase